MAVPRWLTTRRGWLTTVGGLVTVVTGGYHWRRIRHPVAGDLAALLRTRVSYIGLHPAAIDEFAGEYVRRFGALAMSQHHRATVGGLLGERGLARVAPDAAREVRAFERRTVSYFLRSTTYFREPDVRPVRYVAFPDPYEGPCANPFAVSGPE